jgi:enoyl-[acyl-carrier protein] reductase I
MTGVELEGRRLLITGLLTRASIAFAVAERAQRLGADVVLTGFGRRLQMTERAARALPKPPPIVDLDVNSPEDLATLAERVGEHAPALDGVLHSIAFAPESAITGDFTDTDVEAASATFTTSAYSLDALVRAVAPLLREARSPGASVVALDFDASQALPGYDWMGVAKAGLEGFARHLARDRARDRIRVNLVSAGPVRTPAAGGVRVFKLLLTHWKRAAPLGWTGDEVDAIADAACFLLSPWSEGITGELVHVDGGLHALGLRESREQVSAQLAAAAASERR